MNNKNTGFTLLELLVVVGILAALVALALPFYQDYINQSKLVAAQADLQTFQKALALYDQRETTMFGGTDLTPLIGTYLQDYRVFEGQSNPLDPWGTEYVLSASAGVILSYGPNGTQDAGTGIANRKSAGDDLIAIWKPDFFVSSARRVNDRTLELHFSRKVVSSTLVPTAVTTDTDCKGLTKQIVSDTIYRIIFDNDLAPAGDVTVPTAVQAQDGRLLSESKRPSDGASPSTAHTATF